MKTITILIGNSDDKLTQKQWAQFVDEVMELTVSYREQVHFCSPSPGAAIWQNWCMVTTIDEDNLKGLEQSLSRIGRAYNQDSIAVIVGETKFL